MLIHIGVDTVQLNGKGYDIKVHQGDVLKKDYVNTEEKILRIK